MRRSSRLLPLLVFLSLGFVITGSLAGPTFTAGAVTTSSISGRTFQDPNRNGLLDPGEPLLADQQLYLFNGAGAYLRTTISDVNGAYAFIDVAEGDYRVEYASPSWSPLRRDWTPTTTGSIRPSVSLNVSGAATVDFGWRPIVRSTTLGSPMATYVAPNGLRVESYNDAVPPADVYAMLSGGSLIGPEASSITVRLDYGSSNSTATSVAGAPGSYAGYSAAIYIAWGAWLDSPDHTLFHEYGHAWSWYHAFMVQQDGSLASYLEARGIADDPRLGSSYMWSRGEIVADDYRQLFATPAARAVPQMNTELPPAASVAGLREFLATTFRQPPASGQDPADPGGTTIALAISGLSVSPNPVSKSGTVTFSISAPATVTVTVVDVNGGVVRTLLSGASKPAGNVSAKWDRKDGGGRRVKAGTYRASVTAAAATGETTTTAIPFNVA